MSTITDHDRQQALNRATNAYLRLVAAPGICEHTVLDAHVLVLDVKNFHHPVAIWDAVDALEDLLVRHIGRCTCHFTLAVTGEPCTTCTTAGGDALTTEV